MTERILYLIRHGESDLASTDFTDTPRGRQWDPPLGEKGRDQAGLLAKRLAAMDPPAAVSCSPLRRTRETVAPYAELTGVEVTFDDDLMEANIGEWEGKPFEDILASDERILHLLRNQEPIWRHAPGAEELAPFRARVGRAVEAVVGRHPEGNVVVVCHGGVINAYVAPLLGLDHEMFFIPDNTSLNSVGIDGDRRRVRFLNDTLHLTDPHLF
ncbi:MAG TPA: histidine phosphatase family protein [Actinomycetota bacterium]|nr:histidine phosphatase family protein [Actinomycetota bacterium]